MKRNPLAILTPVAPFLAVVLIVAFSLLLPPRASAAESKGKIVGVDYIIALMDAGIDQKEIIHRIEEKNLAFRIAPGDIDRLREAGAGKNLVEVVIGEGVVLENREGAAPSTAAPPKEQGGTDTSQWGRPSRLGAKEKVGPEGSAPSPDATQPPSASTDSGDEAENSDEGITEEPYGGGYGAYSGYGGYPAYGYWPGYYNFVYSYGYPYPYYYYPHYYYPYRSSYYSSPYYSYPHGSYRTYPRGGNSYHSAPRGSGGGGQSRPAPRGSHHH